MGFPFIVSLADHFLSMSSERRIYGELGSATAPLTPHFWLGKIKQVLFCFVSKYFFFPFLKTNGKFFCDLFLVENQQGAF